MYAIVGAGGVQGGCRYLLKGKGVSREGDWDQCGRGDKQGVGGDYSRTGPVASHNHLLTSRP